MRIRNNDRTGRGAAGEPLAFRVVETPLGWMGVVASARGLRGVILPERTREACERQVARLYPGARVDERLLPGLVRDLCRYGAGETVKFDVRFDWPGASDFEVNVWKACARVGYGRTVAYKALAERVGRPQAARAVGLAMGRNRCPIVVPCHRVLRSDGSLGGYSGPLGLRFKQVLLDMEAGTPAATVL